MSELQATILMICFGTMIGIQVSCWGYIIYTFVIWAKGKFRELRKRKRHESPTNKTR